MKSFLMALGLVFGSFLIAGLTYSGTLYMGWLPVPRLITDEVAKLKHMTPQQADTLHKVAELYHVLKTSPEESILAKAEKMFRDGIRAPEAWMKFGAENYAKISSATLQKAKTELEISDQDYDNLKGLWERQLKAFNDSGKIQVTEAEKATLKKFDDEYQISALIKSLK